jgi:hypothetical protein
MSSLLSCLLISLLKSDLKFETLMASELQYNSSFLLVTILPMNKFVSRMLNQLQEVQDSEILMYLQRVCNLISHRNILPRNLFLCINTPYLRKLQPILKKMFIVSQDR